MLDNHRSTRTRFYTHKNMVYLKNRFLGMQKFVLLFYDISNLFSD